MIRSRGAREPHGRAPFRCHDCHWRGWRRWRPEYVPGSDGPREIHQALTESEIERLEPDRRER